MTQISPGELGRRFEPAAQQLLELTEPLSDVERQPPVLRLAALSGRTAQLVAFLLRNTDEGQVASAQHNLQILHDVAEQTVLDAGGADRPWRTASLAARPLPG